MKNVKECFVYYLGKKTRFVPYKKWFYNEYVERFVVFNVLGGTRLCFASSARFQHDDIINLAEKRFPNLVMPPIVTGIAFKGTVIKDLCCFLHDKEVDSYCFKNKGDLEKQFNLTMEMFSFKTVTSPKNFIP